VSIFGNIMSAIFGGQRAGSQASQASGAPTGSQSGAGSPSAPASSSNVVPGTAQSTVDVEAVLNKLAAQNKQKLNWRTSIVDLMKLIDLDSSLAARKQLAQELHYTGDMNDSAKMNIWLHKQVMVKLAQNGGKVPEELRQ
jgi:Domain of unknown function (DUF3597)